MRLAINGWRIHGQRTGVGRYLLNVVRHWVPELLAERFDRATFYTHRPVDRDEIPIPEGVDVRVLGPPWRMLIWENLRLGPACPDDVLYCPSFSRPLWTRARTVVATHEAMMMRHPEMFPAHVRLLYGSLYGWSARNAARVISICHAAAEQVSRHYRVPRRNIRVVYPAPAEHFRPADTSKTGEADFRRRLVGDEIPFFFFVGKMTARTRGLPELIRAFAEFSRRAREPHLLVVLGLEGRARLGAVAREHGVGDRIRFLDYVPDADLNLLYNAARAFVLPSEHEIFSLPVLEAMAVGTPVVCADNAGLREVTAGAAWLLDAVDAETLAGALQRMAGDDDLRRTLSERGLRVSRRYSWSRTSKETLDVLVEAARGDISL